MWLVFFLNFLQTLKNMWFYSKIGTNVFIAPFKNLNYIV